MTRAKPTTAVAVERGSDQYGTRDEVANYLRASVTTVDRLIAARKLGRVKVGRSVRIPWSSVDDYTARQ